MIGRCPPPASAERLEGSPDFLAEDFRLLPGGEASDLVDFVEVDDVRVRRLDPAAPFPDCPKVAICAAAARSSSVFVGMVPPSAGTSRLVWMPTRPSGAWRPIASVTPAPTSPPWAT